MVPCGVRCGATPSPTVLRNSCAPVVKVLSGTDIEASEWHSASVSAETGEWARTLSRGFRFPFGTAALEPSLSALTVLTFVFLSFFCFKFHHGPCFFLNFANSNYFSTRVHPPTVRVPYALHSASNSIN